MMKTVIGAVALALLTGCGFTLPGGSGGEFVGSPHGYAGSGTIRGEKFTIAPTLDGTGAAFGGVAYNADGSLRESDMVATWSDGVTTATGRAALYAALARLCTIAPNHPACSGETNLP